MWIVDSIKSFAKKYLGKVVVMGAGLATGGSLLVKEAFATAPATLAEALTITIDQSVVWSAMVVMLAILGGIAAYYFVKRILGSR